MHLHSSHLNKSGFSLIEILVALGIFALLSLGVGVSISHLFMVQKQVATSDISDNFSSAFFQHMLVPLNCEAAVKAKKLPTGTNELDLVIPTFRGLLPGAPLGIQAGTQVERSLDVNRIFIRQKPGMSQGDEVQFGTETTQDLYRRYILQMVLRLQRKDAQGNPRLLPDRVLEIPVLVKASDPSVIATCMLENSAKEACLSMGGTYVNGRCEFPSECTVHGTFISTSCNNSKVTCAPEYTGPDRNNPITGKASCPKGSCPTQSGRFSISRSVQTGKKDWTTITVTENFYMCMSCPQSPCP